MNSSELFLSEIIKSFKGLKTNAEKAFAQITDEQFYFTPGTESNSVAIIMKHMSGNMLSRFTDFLTTDGEKEWRNRDSEFIGDSQDYQSIIGFWEKGWTGLIETLSSLNTNDLEKIVFIRGEEHTVVRALLRQLAHYGYHTGQIVYLCKMQQNKNFSSLSIPRGESEKYVTIPPDLAGAK